MIKEIDHAIAEILEISELEAEEMRTMVKLMMERRLARAGEDRTIARDEIIIAKNNMINASSLEGR